MAAQTKVGVFLRMILPMVVASLESMLEFLKGLTPDYVDKVIDWVWDFAKGLVKIKTDKIDDDSQQVKDLWNIKKESFGYVAIDSGCEALKDVANRKLIARPKLNYIVQEQLSFTQELAIRIKNGEDITDEEEEAFLAKYELKKKQGLA